MLLVGKFEFRGLENRQGKEKNYVIGHFETVPFDGFLHNFLLSGEAVQNVEVLSRGDLVHCQLEYNDRFNNFRCVGVQPVK